MTRTEVQRPAQVACLACGAEVAVPQRGRVPRWCSSACRHRAWATRTAADAGLVAKEVVERETITNVIHHEWDWKPALPSLMHRRAVELRRVKRDLPSAKELDAMEASAELLLDVIRWARVEGKFTEN